MIAIRRPSTWNSRRVSTILILRNNLPPRIAIMSAPFSFVRKRIRRKETIDWRVQAIEKIFIQVIPERNFSPNKKATINSAFTKNVKNAKNPIMLIILSIARETLSNLS